MQKPKQVNHCTLAHPDPIRQEQEKYAHGYIYKMRRAKDDKEKAKWLNELRSRTDYQEIRQILEGLSSDRAR